MQGIVKLGRQKFIRGCQRSAAAAYMYINRLDCKCALSSMQGTCSTVIPKYLEHLNQLKAQPED